MEMIYFHYALYLESSVKFSQLKYTLSESQGDISIDVIRIGVLEIILKVKVLLGNESTSSSSTATGKYIYSVKQIITIRKPELCALLNIQALKDHHIFYSYVP